MALFMWSYESKVYIEQMWDIQSVVNNSLVEAGQFYGENLPSFKWHFVFEDKVKKFLTLVGMVNK